MPERTFTIGFMPLVDACLPILAHEHGFAEDEGVILNFVRDVSWATVLDRLLYGHTDCAHMLAPMVIAARLGRGRPARPLATPFVLGINGNAITMSVELAAQVASPGEFGDPVEVGAKLREQAAERAARGRKLRFGVVHRYSTHNYKLRYWLAACGIRPDHDVEIVTVSPPFIAESLASGEIDGACVGEPWNSVCVERGVGTIVLAGAQIWRRGIEKVLAMHDNLIERRRDKVEALIRALRKAGKHFIDPENRDVNAEILARPQYLDADATLVGRAITDRLRLAKGASPIHYPDFMLQHREVANFPWVSQATWLYSQMVRWDGLQYSADDAKQAAAAFRPNVYRTALKSVGDDLPSANSKVEGSLSSPIQVGAESGNITLSPNTFFDRKAFDPDHIEAYLAGL